MTVVTGHVYNGLPSSCGRRVYRCGLTRGSLNRAMTFMLPLSMARNTLARWCYVCLRLRSHPSGCSRNATLRCFAIRRIAPGVSFRCCWKIAKFPIRFVGSVLWIGEMRATMHWIALFNRVNRHLILQLLSGRLIPIISRLQAEPSITMIHFTLTEQPMLRLLLRRGARQAR